MASLSVLALLFSSAAVAAQPESGASTDTTISPWQPGAATPAAPAAPVPANSSATTPPAASPAPAASPTPATSPAPTAPAVAPEPAGPNPPDRPPVIRAAPGNWGMTFIFGGLGPLSLGGLGDQSLSDGLLFTEIGVRRVFKKIVLPFSFGAGLTHRSRTATSRPEIAAGVSASIAVLRGFRVWRRIAPYYGGFLHMHYLDAPGPDNWLFNITIGPILGIEYFIADRVSLYGQGILGIGPDIQKNTIRLAAQAVMAAGGQLGLTFYF